jgi:hypothetical protein
MTWSKAMNIFVLDNNPAKAAALHLDKHVVKMPLETAQMLSTVNGGYPYKATHKNHPCTIWASKSKANYEWLVNLGVELCKEYTHRYGKVHKCQAVIEQLKNPPECVPDGDLMTFAQAMPDECKREDAVEAYRAYYRANKAHIAKWTKRDKPEWMV